MKSARNTLVLQNYQKLCYTTLTKPDSKKVYCVTSRCFAITEFYLDQITDDLSGYKIALVKEGFEDAEEDVARIVREAAHRLTEKGATVEEVSVPIHKDGKVIGD